MARVKFEFDPHNRLTVTGSAIKGIRQVLDGQFKVDADNTLIYHIKAPIPAGIDAPYQVKLNGTWSLTDDHRLRLTLDKWQRRTFGDQVTLQGELLDVRKNALAFSVTTMTKAGLPSVYVLELRGAWQADARNRLTFRVKKADDESDTLTFDAAWQLDDQYQLIYSFQKQDLIRRTKQLHTLAFKGFWDITDKARLSYIIDRDSVAGFDFHTGIGIFRQDYIKYEIGVGVSRRKYPVKRQIIFRGAWNLRKDAGLVFEVREQGKKLQTLVLGARARLTAKGSIAFNLRGSSGRDLAAELELSRDIFKGDGQAFVRLLASKKESAIVAGCGWHW